MGNLVCHRNSKAIVRIYEPIRVLPDVRLKPFLIPDAIKAARGDAILPGTPLIYYKYRIYLSAIVRDASHANSLLSVDLSNFLQFSERAACGAEADLARLLSTAKKTTQTRYIWNTRVNTRI